MDRRILVVDDSELSCQQISLLLARPDRRIKVVTDGTEALERLVDGNFSLVIIDLYLEGNGIEGMDLIREIRQRDLPVTIIVMTAHASIDAAVEAMKLGAFDFVTKPIDPDQVQVLVERALADRTLQDEVTDARERLRQRFGFHNLLGTSAGMREVFSRVERVASASCNVLINGETGTGKELVAQALHQADATRSGPMIAVNCAALPEPLLESELFGHERAHSLVPTAASKAASNWPRTAPFSSTRLASYRLACRPSCFESCRTAPSNASAAATPSR